MKLYVNVTTASGEVLERFAILSGDCQINEDPQGVAIEQTAAQVRDLIEMRFETAEAT